MSAPALIRPQVRAHTLSSRESSHVSTAHALPNHVTCGVPQATWPTAQMSAPHMPSRKHTRTQDVLLDRQAFRLFMVDKHANGQARHARKHALETPESTSSKARPHARMSASHATSPTSTTPECFRG